MIRTWVVNSLLWVGMAALASPVFGASGRDSFDDRKPGSSLEGSYEVGFTGKKGAPKWSVEVDKGAPSPPQILSQTGTAVYNRLIRKAVMIKDGSVEARVRIVAGKVDPEVGLVWRYVNADNYYYVRSNSTESNIVFYKMQGGKKTSLKSVDLKVGHAWHLLRVEYKGDSVSIFCDGKEVLIGVDRSIREAGSVGLFTTADTVAHFDDFKFDGNP